MRLRQSAVLGWGLFWGLAVVGLGCTQPVPKTMPSAGEFFRRVGPVSMLKMADRQPETDQGRSRREAAAADGSVPAIPDSKIRLDLGMKLEEAKVSAADVDFSVDDQRVVLEGTAYSYVARDRIELLAREVQGVRAVDNRLEVNPAAVPAPDGGTDGG